MRLKSHIYVTLTSSFCFLEQKHGDLYFVILTFSLTHAHPHHISPCLRDTHTHTHTHTYCLFYWPTNSFVKGSSKQAKKAKSEHMFPLNLFYLCSFLYWTFSFIFFIRTRLVKNNIRKIKGPLWLPWIIEIRFFQPAIFLCGNPIVGFLFSGHLMPLFLIQFNFNYWY